MVKNQTQISVVQLIIDGFFRDVLFSGSGYDGVYKGVSERRWRTLASIDWLDS